MTVQLNVLIKLIILSSLLSSCLRQANDLDGGSGGEDETFVINTSEPTGGTEPEPINPYEEPSDEGRPSLNRIGDKVISAGDELRITLMASDPQNDMLTFNLRTGLPEGAHFIKDAGLFTWTPVDSQAGMRFLLTFEVSDGTLKDQETISVEVTGTGETVNLPPTIDPISDQILVAGSPWRYQVQASDPNGDSVQFSISGRPVPEGLIFDEVLGSASWTPTEQDVGSVDLIVTVTDGMSSAEQQMRLIVESAENPNPTTAPPQFIDQPAIEVTLGQEVRFEVQVSYEGSEPLMISLEQSPEPSARFDPSTRVFSWTPSAAQAYELIFSVTDGIYRDFMRVDVVVNPVDTPVTPETCPPDPNPTNMTQTLSSGVTLSGQILCREDEKDLFTFTLSEESNVELSVSFESSNDIDLYLYSDPTEVALLASSADFRTSSESITTSLPAGTYYVAVLLYSGSAATYSISYSATRVDPTGPVNCESDRLEPNDSRSNPFPLTPNLYSDLSACGEGDWYATTVNSGYPIVVYVSSSDPDASVLIESSTGEVAGVSFQSVPPNADGCLTLGAPRAYCLRVEGFLASVTRYHFKPFFSRAGVEYDLRVRMGDQVSSGCDPSLGSECDPNYQCITEFNGELFFAGGTCSRSCTSASDCQGFNRACIADSMSSFDQGMCFQTCDTNSDCRSDFECRLEMTVEGAQREVCF